MASGGWPGEERRGAALYSPVLTSISVCPAQVIPTIKILLLIPLHPPHFAGKLPRSPLCLHSTFLQKGQGRTSPSWSINPLQLVLITNANTEITLWQRAAWHQAGMPTGRALAGLGAGRGEPQGRLP